MTGSTLHAENTRIDSQKHVLQTVSTNEICLSVFDDKCHILNEGIKILPFGYYKIDRCRVKNFCWNSHELEWHYKNKENYAHLLLDSSPNGDQNDSFVVPDITISGSPEEWETPDPGLEMTNIINQDNIDSENNVILMLHLLSKPIR